MLTNSFLKFSTPLLLLLANTNNNFANAGPVVVTPGTSGSGSGSGSGSSAPVPHSYGSHRARNMPPQSGLARNTHNRGGPPLPVSGFEAPIAQQRPPTPVDGPSIKGTTAGPSKSATSKAYFSNWAGALWVYENITQVEGTANVPYVSVPPGGNSDLTWGGAVWVGIDGDTCGSAILQTGIDWTIQDGQTTYNAWYEWYPSPLTNFDGFNVSPGDSISMRVVATSTTSGAAYITNESTGQTVSQQFSNQPALCLQNAEWIVEDFSTNGNLIPFAEFSPIQISNSSWTANNIVYGLEEATVIDIQQNNQVLTNCNVQGRQTVDCTYTGN